MTEQDIVERLTDAWDGMKRYQVSVGGKVVGIVSQYKPTFEHKSKGRMYVNSRWTSKRPRWIYEYSDSSITHNPFRYWVETRKEAVRALLEKQNG